MHSHLFITNDASYGLQRFRYLPMQSWKQSTAGVLEWQQENWYYSLEPIPTREPYCPSFLSLPLQKPTTNEQNIRIRGSGIVSSNGSGIVSSTYSYRKDRTQHRFQIPPVHYRGWRGSWTTEIPSPS